MPREKVIINFLKRQLAYSSTRVSSADADALDADESGNDSIAMTKSFQPIC